MVIKFNSTGNTIWARVLVGDGHCVGRSVVEINDNCYIVTGYALFDNGNFWDVILLKFDNSGNLIWARTAGSTTWDYGNSIKLTSDNCLIVAGECGWASGKVFLLKYDMDGNLLWHRIAGGPNSAKDTAESVDETGDGGYIVTGFSRSDGEGQYDILLMKFDSAGNPLWMKTYGGPYTDIGRSVEVTHDESYLVCGMCQ